MYHTRLMRALSAGLIAASFAFAPLLPNGGVSAATRPSDLIITGVTYDVRQTDDEQLATFTVSVNNAGNEVIDGALYLSAVAGKTAAYPVAGFTAEEYVNLTRLQPNRTALVTFQTPYRIAKGAVEETNIVFSVDTSLTAERSNLIEETAEDNNTYTRFVRIGKNPFDYKGDGAYEFKFGQRVRLDSGIVVEPVVRMENGLDNVYFTVYNEQGTLVGTTETFLRAAWPAERLSVGGKTFMALVTGTKLVNGSPVVTASLTHVSYDREALPDLIVTALTALEQNYLGLKIENVGKNFEAADRIVAVTVEDTETGDTYRAQFATPFERGIVKSNLRTEQPLKAKADGIYKLRAVVDSSDQIAEASEGNNELSATLQITSTSTTPTSTPVTPKPTPEPEDTTPAQPAGNGLRLKLGRSISSIEQAVIALERKLTTRIDSRLSRKLRGRILLQVEQNGEAWYIDPKTENKIYLKDGTAAYDIMRLLGLGISTADLEKIPVGLDKKLYNLTDTDGDGLPDVLETALGSNGAKNDSDGDGQNDWSELMKNQRPAGKGNYPVNQALAENLKGKIVLQVQSKGEAWYVNPADGKRYFLGDPKTAYNAMRFLSLGIKNDDLRTIQVGEFE